MSTYKNTSGDLTLTGNGGLATLTVNYANTVFTGNLTYTGNLTTVDDFIVVAANNNGTVQDMGLLAGVNVGNGQYAGLRFDVASNSWQISSNVNGLGVGTYSTILSSSAFANAAGSNTQIQFNQGGVFGASANLSFNYSTNRLFLTGSQAYANIANTPVYTGNGVVVYNKAMGGGGTGLYVINTSVDDELVSKSKAIVYGIIF
jgi:hypothetical protein